LKRKIVQFQVVPVVPNVWNVVNNYIYALADDGTMWFYGTEWWPISQLPETVERVPATCTTPEPSPGETA
jgi:hypothetical protein